MNLESNHKRILAGSLLLILLVSLCIFYSEGRHMRNLDYTIYGIAKTNQYSPGDLVYMEGMAINTYKGGYDFYYHHRTMHVQSSLSPSKWDSIRIIGVLVPDNQIINIRRTEVTELWKLAFILLRSFFALIFLLYIFHYYWYFDSRKFVFRRR